MTPHPPAAGAPSPPPSTPRSTSPSGSGAAAPTRPPSAAAVLDDLFGGVWPDRDVPARPLTVVTAVAVGLLAAVVLPYRELGLGTVLVLLAVGAAAVTAAVRTRRTPYLLGSLALAAALALTPVLRDAAWIGVLCVLAAAGVTVVALVDARSVMGVLGAGLAVPLGALRGLPWLGRSLRHGHATRPWVPALRTGAVSLALVTVFVALFASADVVFARWVDAATPDLTVDSLGLRTLVLAIVAAGTLAATYVSLDPPSVERLALPPGRPVARWFEWVVPVALVLAVSAAFVLAQATAMFGGHGYLERTTGLTYAEHVHQGFAQLTVATLLTLVVIAVTARHAPVTTSADRLLLRLLLGGLCAVAMVVVVSALHRMHLYEQAYGFTRLRLLVSVFEGWLGLVLLLVAAAGVRLSGRWLPRAAVLTGAAALLGLAILNPDGYVAAQNVQRYADTGRVDWDYLAGLSDDAVPALRELPAEVVACVLGPEVGLDRDDWLEWNLGRARADAETRLGGGCP